MFVRLMRGMHLRAQSLLDRSRRVPPPEPEPRPPVPGPRLEPAYMHTSQRGRDLIRSFEGERLTAYLCPAKVWTIGVGHTGPDVKPGMTITREQSEALLQADLMRFEDAVRKHARTFTQNQFDALVSFSFNVGINAMARSTLIRMHKAGDYRAAADQFLRWDKAGGKRLAGLSRRRAAERALYLA